MNNGLNLTGNGINVFVPFKKVPDLGGEYTRRFREVEIQYKILQFITPLYEQAKVEEKRQTPSVLILDKAGPAERKSKPKVLLYALLAFVSSLLISLIVVFTKEGIEKIRNLYPTRFGNILSVLRNDWFGLRFKKRSLNRPSEK